MKAKSSTTFAEQVDLRSCPPQRNCIAIWLLEALRTHWGHAHLIGI